MRFLHLADIHLDTALRSRTREMADELRRASRTAFEAAVEVALREEVDAVLIAGDLFDGQRLSVQTERFLYQTLNRLDGTGIQVVYATGNHDPGEASGPAARVTWPANVHRIDGPEPVSVPILRQGTPVGIVTAAGHATSRVTDDLSRRFPRPASRSPQVGLLHTQVLGSRGGEGHDPYAPSELSYLKGLGYDYWALGHVHVRQMLSESPPIHYSGNPQGRNPREVGAKGGLLVDLSSRESPRVEFIELGRVRWETLHVGGIEGEAHTPALTRRIEREWERHRETDGGRPDSRYIVRVELEGPSPLSRDLARDETREDIREALIASLGLLDAEVRCAGVRSLERVDDHLNRDDVLGEALRHVRELAAPDGPSPSVALDLSHSSLAGASQLEGEQLDAYLRALLRGGDAALLEALLRRPDR